MSQETSFRRFVRFSPSASKNASTVALSRPGAAQAGRPLSWSTTTVR